MEKKDKKIPGVAIAIGIVIGMILYKVVFDIFWPMIFD